MLDERSYRGPNSPNRQTEMGDGRHFWIRNASVVEARAPARARLKAIAGDMPISLVVPDLNPDAEGRTRRGQR